MYTNKLFVLRPLKNQEYKNTPAVQLKRQEYIYSLLFDMPSDNEEVESNPATTTGFVWFCCRLVKKLGLIDGAAFGLGVQFIEVVQERFVSELLAIDDVVDCREGIGIEPVKVPFPAVLRDGFPVCSVTMR